MKKMKKITLRMTMIRGTDVLVIIPSLAAQLPGVNQKRTNRQKKKKKTTTMTMTMTA
jgi:hypothetical protein